MRRYYGLIRGVRRCLAFVAAVLLLASCKSDDGARAFYSELRSVNKLVLGQMTITKLATVDDLRLDEADGMRQTAAALLNQLKIGDRKAAYSYSTYLRAYVDMSALGEDDISIDERNKRVRVKLPPVQTEFAGRDLTVREEHYRVTGLRSSIGAEERARVKENMSAALREEVESKPYFRRQLVERAQAKARAYFSALAAQNGYTAEVEFS